MRYLVISDIHSNLEALEAVVAAAAGAYGQIVCCGDLVGYGADPNPVVEWVRDHASIIVRGNHDKACCGIEEPDNFNPEARYSALWTRKQLSPASREYLRSLPSGPVDCPDGFSIFHGSPRDEDEYIHFAQDAGEVIGFVRQRVSFFGHTHLQGGFFRLGKAVTEEVRLASSPSNETGIAARGKLELKPDATYLLNPGAAGQPRDRDWRAAFAIYDTNGFVAYGRAAYDAETALKKIRAAGLPDFHAARLQFGR